MLLHLLQDIHTFLFPTYLRWGESYSKRCSVFWIVLLWQRSVPAHHQYTHNLEGGYQDPPGEEMRLAVEKGEIHPHAEGDFSIEAGSYKFLQLPIAPQADLIANRLLELLSDGPSVIYLRILKESVVELVVQLLFKS